MKELYKFSIEIEKEIEKVDTKEENGQKITTTQMVKEKVPIEFIIKKPSRSEKEEAEIIRAALLSSFIRRGVMPEAVLSKTYSDQGGIMDEIDKKHYADLTFRLSKKIEEFQLINQKEEKDKSEICLKEIIELRKDLTSFQYQQSSFFENTAEYKARTKLIEYLFTLLVYWKFDTKQDIQPYFKGNNFDERLKSLELLEDNDDEVYLKIRDRALFVISLYTHTGGSVNQEDIRKMVDENFKPLEESKENQEVKK